LDEKQVKPDGGARSAVSRRAFIASSAAAAVGAAAGVLGGASAASAAPSYTKVPKLPSEISRMDTQFTKAGNPYEVIDVNISGDRTRIFVPHASPPNKYAWVPVIWFYHANNSSYAALSSAFKWGADPAVDYGAISVAPNNGGSSEWVTPNAVTAHKNAIAYVNSLWRVFYSFGRANSGGGSLMCWAFGNNMLPRQVGMYLGSGTYDMKDLWDRDTARVGPTYGYDESLMQATNPKNLPQSAWTGIRIRASYSTEDQIVPADRHCLALISLAAPVAVETSSIPHDGGGEPTGHTVPGWVNNDMLLTFKRWANL
jgi:hypothetical protein